MSKSYYLVDRCNHCGNVGKLKIGATAVGWDFNFQSQYDDTNHDMPIKSWEKWKVYLFVQIKRGLSIEDEYEVNISLNEFIKMVEYRHTLGLQNSADVGLKDGFRPGRIWLDDEGYSFCNFDSGWDYYKE